MGHQKAAFEMLTHLFTPETATQTPLGRMIVSWYGRFDIFIAMMGGFPTMLAPEWFITFVEYCDQQAISDEADSLHWKLEAESGRLRVISREMSTLFARGSRGQITPEDFATEHERLQNSLQGWKDGWDHALTDPAYYVTDFSHAGSLGEDNIVDPFITGVLYDFPIFSTTLLTSEFNSTMMMHKCQSSTTQREHLYGELRGHAYAICQIFEAVERWPSSPRGSLILIQACIALSALFLPQDAKHHNWIRKKFALLETMGYVDILATPFCFSPRPRTWTLTLMEIYTDTYTRYHSAPRWLKCSTSPAVCAGGCPTTRATAVSCKTYGPLPMNATPMPQPPRRRTFEKSDTFLQRCKWRRRTQPRLHRSRTRQTLGEREWEKSREGNRELRKGKVRVIKINKEMGRLDRLGKLRS